MAIRAVFFDVGETLVDEERYWREVARPWGRLQATPDGALAIDSLAEAPAIVSAPGETQAR